MQTRADHVYASLRADILACRLAPGRKIRINEVAATLAVSVGAVREALSRLAAEGMAVATAQKGYTVPSVSIEELNDLTKTRIDIEKLCLRSAVDRGDIEWETTVVGAYHRLNRIPERDPEDPSRLNEAWSSAHVVFHTALVAASGSPWLARLRDLLFAQTERYRQLSVPLRRGERDVNAEHKALMEAAIARDADRACLLMEKHLWRTANIILTSPLILDRFEGENGS